MMVGTWRGGLAAASDARGDGGKMTVGAVGQGRRAAPDQAAETQPTVSLGGKGLDLPRAAACYRARASSFYWLPGAWLSRAVYLGIGGYAFVLLAVQGVRWGLVQWVRVIATSAPGAGAVSLRTPGICIILITFAFGQTLCFSAVKYPGADGATTDVDGTPPLHTLSQFGGVIGLSDKSQFRYFWLALLAPLTVIVWRLVNSRLGNAIQGAGEGTGARDRSILRGRLAVFAIAAVRPATGASTTRGSSVRSRWTGCPPAPRRHDHARWHEFAAVGHWRRSGTGGARGIGELPTNGRPAAADSGSCRRTLAHHKKWAWSERYVTAGHGQ